MNTYTYPANDAKTNFNGNILVDHYTNYFGCYYAGHTTRFTNTGEQDLIQQPNSSYTMEAFMLGKDSIIINSNMQYVLTGGKFYRLDNLESDINSENAIFNNKGEGWIIKNMHAKQYLYYFTKTTKIQLDSITINHGYFHLMPNAAYDKNGVVLKLENFKLHIQRYAYQQKIQETILPFPHLGIRNANWDNKYGILIYIYNGVNNFMVKDTTGHILGKFDDDRNKLFDGILQKLKTKNNYFPIQDIQTKKKYKHASNGLLMQTIAINHRSAFLIGTDNCTHHAFTYITKYPKIFNNTHSNSIFSIAQDAQENMYIGSYTGELVKMDAQNNIKTIAKDFVSCNGNLVIGKDVYFSRENYLNSPIHKISNGITPIVFKDKKHRPGFYLHKSSKNMIYFGTAQQGLDYIAQSDFEANNGNWKNVAMNRLGDFVNILTITEDKLGRIWFGHSRKGVCIYNPESDSLQLFLMSANKTNIGAFSSLTDAKGTVWIGTGFDGLYAVDGNKKNILLSDFKKIIHPFFTSKNRITAMAIHGNHLIINAYDKTLVLDLTLYYHGKINIKYLSTQESNYTSFTEQNTMLVAKDSSVWYSTSDMLYKWDFKTWRALPKEKINLIVTVDDKNKRDTISLSSTINIAPTENSIQFVLNYYNKDLLPRYFTTAFVYEQDTIVWSKPNTEVVFNASNLKPGDYVFHIKILELDGTTTYHQYKICVDDFWYKKWWVIGLMALLLLSGILAIAKQRQLKLDAQKQLQIEKAEAENKQAKLQTDLSRLQMNSIGNQFRPHFLLNTLNQLGAYLKGSPEAESILSRLGESIDIVFAHSTKNTNTHAMHQELMLVSNVVSIHQIMLIKKLQYTYLPLADMEKLEEHHIPFGLLQIPIENALLHGLNNKLTPPYLLSLTITETNDNYIITIIDNGIGRSKSNIISSASKHGTGIKNLEELIDILNQKNRNKISIVFTDDIYKENNIAFGTQVTITLPKTYNYDII
jgi:Histidine kinase